MITFIFASFIPIIDFAMLSYSTAEKMVDNIMEYVEDYTGNKIPEDDMTLVIIKTDH